MVPARGAWVCSGLHLWKMHRVLKDQEGWRGCWEACPLLHWSSRVCPAPWRALP